VTPPQDGNDPGSIRDRLKAPVPSDAASSGGDSSRSAVSDESFQQTDSAALRESHGRSERQESTHAGLEPRDELTEPRETDVDPHAAKVAERKVASLFLLSALATVGFVVWYLVGDHRFGTPGNPYFNPILGLLMGISLLGIGAGTVLWAKLLMVDEEAVQERHPFGSPPEERAATAEALQAGLDDAGVKRRPLLLGTLALSGALLAVLPLPFVLGMGRFQHKERELATTAWRGGMRLRRSNGTPVRLGDLQLGAIESVFPDVELPQLRADSPVLLIRMRPEELQVQEGREDWSIDGHIAYSSICTHLGCPVKLYEQRTHHLFCPCHQSTFDASRGSEVIFGPAARPLPQLAISVDDEGYFVAQGDFDEPTGPSYWERSS
jgi:ubiquinol-cytochrome c reductase iron-sulfur subunit